ncbi:MAG: FAD-binding protein [Bacteroidetes bacterium]|nr:FAD-binding protein [Bacteroidota bacterium]
MRIGHYSVSRLIKTDVLVIGSGGAGLRCAIELFDKNIDVTVVGKCKKGDAHTILARGGINAALGNMDPEDSWQLHAADTIKDGGEINDHKAVELLCKNAPKAISELAQWGTDFHKEKNGKISQRFFGAATFRRACFVGDCTGKAILETLIKQTNKRNIKIEEEVYIFALLKNKRKINGALGLEINTGNIIAYNCKILILGTGGHSRVFNRSSSRFWENNGDGIGLGFDVGAEFMDMEMFQFHPTGMVYPKEALGTLVTEAVRGEGGILTNKDGERFMIKYDKKRMELSARDIVARANFIEIEEGRGTKHDGVWLDITHRYKKDILKKLPVMYNQFKKLGKIDITKEKMEVAPTAHYSMGGLHINHENGKTSIPGLYAIGEVTSGVHGANRLGGNSLAEIIVFGKLTAQSLIREIKKMDNLVELDKKLINVKCTELENLSSTEGKDPIYIKEELQEMMWEHVGVIRDEKKMKKGIRLLELLKKEKLNTGLEVKMNKNLIAALNIKSMLIASEMILISALNRKESRGAHYRTDYPYKSSDWKKNIICVPKRNAIEIKFKSIPLVPKTISKLMNHKFEYNKKRHMLE